MGNKLLLVDFQPCERRILVSYGTNLLEAARRAGIPLDSVCGGQGVCGGCQVAILEGQVSVLTEEEEENLTTNELQNQHRLACCTRVYSAVRVYIPDESMAPEPQLTLYNET